MLSALVICPVSLMKVSGAENLRLTMGERGILKACPLTIDGAYFSCQLHAKVKFQHAKMGK